MIPNKFDSPTKDAAEESPSADRTGRCPMDSTIRSRGYLIRSRRGGQEPTWEKDGTTFTQAEVIHREGLG